MADLHPSFRAYLVRTYCGSMKSYEKCSFETKKQLLKDALKQHYITMSAEYGSFYEFQCQWAKRSGFKSFYDYLNWLAQTNGYKDHSDYQNEQAKKMGFKNRGERRLAAIKKKGFKGWMDYLEDRAKKSGFNSYSERRKAWRPKGSSNINCQHTTVIKGEVTNNGN